MKGSFYGTSREDEAAKLEQVNGYAVAQIERMKANVTSLQAELGDLREVYDLDEKEGLALWFNKDARYQQVRQDLLRAQRTFQKPYFGRIDFEDSEEEKRETYYIGKTTIGPDVAHPVVLDWRAPVSSIYYEQNLGSVKYKVPYVGIRQVDLKRKRTYEIDKDRLVDFFDTEVVANDELLTKYLSKSKQTVLSEIIATIQQEQNDVIRKNPHHNVLIQGSAGSGKTTVAMHRISYILYNYEDEFPAKYFYIIGSNKVLLNYITGVLPDLDVYDISQLTMEEMFVRLLRGEWDKNIHSVRHVEKSDLSVSHKGSDEFHQKLSEFATTKIKELYIARDIVIPQTKHVMLSGREITEYLEKYSDKPLYFLQEFLTERLMERVEQEVLSFPYIYDIDEKRKALTHYKRFFTRLIFKESVFDLYEEFIKTLDSSEAPYEKDHPDLYDLAALAYLRKRLKDSEDYLDVCHVVIDEAQDFGIAVYKSLKYCLNRCTYTIMGDVSQNINFGCGMGDWESLQDLFLPDPYDYFGILKKSYRNTIEISDFANNILKHGTFPLYPVEPILRHGDEVLIKKAASEESLPALLLGRINELKAADYETIAVICSDEKETANIARELKKETDIHVFSEDDTEFLQGVTVLPIEYAKGLEFDAVIIANASSKNYPKEDRFAKLLYVAATRALHDLSVFYTDSLTGLVADPIPEGRLNPVFKEDTFHKVPRIMEEDFRTKEEIAKDMASEGEKDIRLRDNYGPRRIDPSTNNTPKVGMASVIPKPAVKVNRYVAIDGKSAPLYPAPASPKAPERKAAGTSKNTGSASEFGQMPDGTSITPIGHGTINNAARWVSITKGMVTVTGNYGLLILTPLSEGSVKVEFTKNTTPPVSSGNPSFKWNARENRDDVDISLGKLNIKIDKKNGALTFLAKDGRKLLSENPSPARQYFEQGRIFWDYIAFHKEILKAYNGLTDEWIDVSSTARYISTTENPAPKNTILMSMKGYQLEIPSKYKVMLCTVPSVNPYLKFENTDKLEYTFSVAK